MIRSLLLTAVLATVPFGLEASVDPDLLALVPSNAQAVGSIDAARARSSTFGQFLLNKSDMGGQDLREFVEETGFDPRHDLQGVVFAQVAEGEGQKSGRGLLLARGSFDHGRIRAAAQAKGAKIRTWSGVEVLVGGTGTNENVLAFPRRDVALMGDAATVQAVLANRSAPSVLDASLQKQIDQIGRDNDAWFASVSMNPSFLEHLDPGKAGGGNGSGDAQGFDKAKIFQSIVQSAGGMRFGDLIEVVFQAQTRSPQDASSLADVVRFFSSMVQMERGKDPRAGILASAFDSMTLHTTGTSVQLGFSISEKDMERLTGSDSHDVVSFDWSRQ